MFFRYFQNIKDARKAKDNATIASMPEPYCNDRPAHYYWRFSKWGCPMCNGKRQQVYEDTKRRVQNAELAKTIVDEFIRQFYHVKFELSIAGRVIVCNNNIGENT